MIAVIVAGGGFIGALLVHLVVWRLRLPTRETTALAAVFAIGLVATLVIGMASLQTFHWVEALYSASLYAVCALTYLLLYTAITADSPSLSLARFIGGAGAGGRSAAEIDEFVRQRPFVLARLIQLEKTGFVVRSGETLELAEKATAAIKTGDFYRKLMGRTSWGG